MGLMKSALNFLGLKNNDTTGGAALTGSLDEYLTELVSMMGYDVRFTSTQTDDGIRYDMEGDEMDAFLGESCEMLEALAHISMRYARRLAVANGMVEEPRQPVKEGEEDPEARKGRIFFECGDFRQRKVDDIRNMAEEKRQRVMDGGRPVYISALGPADRKVIHTFLAETGNVVSESIGSGYFKRIRLRMKDSAAGSTDGGGPRRHNNSNGGGNRGRGGFGGQRRGPGQDRGPNRGGGGGGRNHNQPRNPDGANRAPGNDFESTFMNFHDEPNGNVAPRENFSEENDSNDNIGNRLKPGEQPSYGQGPVRGDDN